MIALLKKELNTFFSHASGSIIILSFLLANSAFLWILESDFNIINSGFAQMDGLFSLSPFLLIIFIPALSMRLFADEYKEGTIERLKTLPISNSKLVLSKYFSGLIVTILAIAPTLVYYFSIYQLSDTPGNVDSAGIFGSYIGLLLLSSLFVSIGVFASSTTKNQITSFLIAIIICSFFYFGFDLIASEMPNGKIELAINYLGIDYHYTSLSKGVIDSRDIIYFLSLIVLFIQLTIQSISSNKYFNKQLLLNVLILVLLNVVASFYFFRLDLTEEKRHSLNDTTKEIVKSLDDIAYVKVYLDGDLPSGFIRLKNATKSILDELRNYSPYIEYEFINTNDFTSIEERNKLFIELSENGLEPTNLQVQENNGNSEQIIFPGALVYYKGRTQSLNLLQNQIGTNPEYVLNNSIEDIEFELTNALFKIKNNGKPNIAFLDGHKGLNELETADITHSLSQIKGSLSEYFNVERINIKEFELDANNNPSLSNQLDRLNKYKALIIAKPTEKFSKVDKFLIDQYIMNGGKTIWFIDGVVMDMDSLKGNSPFSMAIPNDLNLTDMFFKYGVRVNFDLVMDFQADKIPIVVGYQGDVPQQQLLPWLYNPIFIPKSKHPIVKNLDGIKSSFVSSLDTVKAVNIKKTPILFSSPYSKLPKAPHRVSLNILEQNPTIEQYNHGEIPVGYLLEGEFESVFANRLAPNNDNLKPLNKGKANKMIVFGDGDLIKNHVNSSSLSYPLGYNHYSKTQYQGNKHLIVNALNYILGNDNIINIRSKEVNLRLLNKKEVKENKMKWQLINTVVPIVIISLLISLILFRRKKRYR